MAMMTTLTHKRMIIIQRVEGQSSKVECRKSKGEGEKINMNV